MSEAQTISPPAAADTADSLDVQTHPTVTGISNEKLAMWVFLGSECLLFGALISTYMLYKNRTGLTAGGHGSPIRMSDLYDIPFTSVSSFVLLASSLTMVFAVVSIARGDMPRLKLWLVTTAALGAIFVGGQVYEFTGFVREGLEVRTQVLEQRAERQDGKVSYDEPFVVTMPSKHTLTFEFLKSGDVKVNREGEDAAQMKPEDIGAGFTSSVSSSAFYALTGFHGVHVTLGILMLLITLALASAGRITKRNSEAVEIVGLYWHFVDVIWVLIFTIIYLIP